MKDKNNGKCAVCEKDATRHVRVIYSSNPWGQDSDDVDLCYEHLAEAKSRYDVIEL